MAPDATLNGQGQDGGMVEEEDRKKSIWSRRSMSMAELVQSWIGRQAYGQDIKSTIIGFLECYEGH